MNRGEADMRSHLLLLRLWAAEPGDERGEWYGRLQHVFTGEAHNFYDWPELIDALVAMMLPGENPDQGQAGMVRQGNNQ